VRSFFGIGEEEEFVTKVKMSLRERNVVRIRSFRAVPHEASARLRRILVAIYHMLSQQVSYNDLGDLYLDRLNKDHLARNLIHRLQRLASSKRNTSGPFGVPRGRLFSALPDE